MDWDSKGVKLWVVDGLLGQNLGQNSEQNLEQNYAETKDEFGNRSVAKS